MAAVVVCRIVCSHIVVNHILGPHIRGPQEKENPEILELSVPQHLFTSCIGWDIGLQRITNK